MISIEVDGQRLGLCFSHPKIEGDPRIQRITECQLFNLSGAEAVVLAKNEAACSVKDNFQRATGRKLALARTICQHDYGFSKPSLDDRCLKCGSGLVPYLELTKEARTKIWLSYFDAIKPVYPEPEPATSGQTKG